MPSNSQARTTEFVHTATAVIEVVVEGDGPTVILLPSLGRESYDYDEVADGLAQNGFRVARPQPRGIAAAQDRWRTSRCTIWPPTSER